MLTKLNIGVITLLKRGITMSIHFRKIGNSHGILFPKYIVDKLGVTNDFVIDLIDDYVVIKKKRQPRDGWEEQFLAAKNDGIEDDDFSDWQNITNEFDKEEEWEW